MTSLVDRDADTTASTDTTASADMDTDTTTSTAPTETDPGADPERVAAVGQLADALGHAMRALQRGKAHFIAESGGELGAHIALAKVVHDGPLRVSALADMTQCDASTTSRQVAALVKDGLLERQADPDDGRASLLVATDKGRAAVAGFRTHRDRAFSRMLGDWDLEDVHTLHVLLERFAGRLTDHVHTPPAASAAGTGREEN